MGIGDLGKKAQDALGTEQGEQKSDDALQKGSDALGEKTGGKYDEQIDKGRDAADKRIGDE
jgi:hypothetical protein